MQTFYYKVSPGFTSKKNEPVMVTANKIYGKYRTGNDIFWIKKK
jgi:hypothetical protein